MCDKIPDRPKLYNGYSVLEETQMPLAPIVIQLSPFEQIEILRHEIEQFEEELKKTEVRIREVLYQVEKQRYLGSVHPVFQHGQHVPDGQALPELYNARETLASAIDAMKGAMTSLEAVTGTAPAAPRPGQRTLQPGPARPSVVPPAAPNPNVSNPGLRRSRFDAF
jgi:hypothetical protein